MCVVAGARHYLLCGFRIDYLTSGLTVGGGVWAHRPFGGLIVAVLLVLGYSNGLQFRDQASKYN